MKKNLIKKVFAVSLSIAMACSFLPTANPVTASAAAPYVSLKTTFKTLKVKQTYKMTLKNNTINWKIRKVETTNKPVATVYGKTTSSVMIKGKSEGRATIRVHLRTTERKRNNTKTLRCRVKVVPAETVTPVTPTQTEATVTTQDELTAALANANLTKLTIKPATGVNLTIPSGTYSNVDVVVDAPGSDIENNATFKSIQIDNIKSDTWIEKGRGNTINVRAPKASIRVEEGAVVGRLTFSGAKADVKVVVNKGTINGITISATVKLSITGTKADSSVNIPVTVESTAANSEITTDVPADINTAAVVSVVFQANAENSTVTLTTSGISATIDNQTAKPIVVTRNDGYKSEVKSKTKSTVTAVNTTTTPGGSTTGGGTTGGGTGTTTVTQRVPVTVPAAAYSVTVSNAAITKTASGTSVVAVDVNIARNTDVVVTSLGSIKYVAQIYKGSTPIGSSSGWQTIKGVGSVSEIPSKLIYQFDDVEVPEGTELSELSIEVSFCVANDYRVYYNNGSYYSFTTPYRLDSNPVTIRKSLVTP